MNTRLVTLSFAMLAATVFVPPAQAQRHVAAVSRGGGARTNFVRLRRIRPYFAGSAFAPYFYLITIPSRV